jgi:alcohol dehydrogenase class IV
VRSGASELVEPAIAGMQVARFQGFSPNPKIEDVERGVSVWRRELPTHILAVGGGSVLDVAKLIGLLGPNAASWRVLLRRPLSGDVCGAPVIAVPTTAGSGAEATQFATFYAGGIKHSLSHSSLRPSYAIIDSLLTASVPTPVAARAASTLWRKRSSPSGRSAPRPRARRWQRRQFASSCRACDRQC